MIYILGDNTLSTRPPRVYSLNGNFARYLCFRKIEARHSAVTEIYGDYRRIEKRTIDAVIENHVMEDFDSGREKRSR